MVSKVQENERTILELEKTASKLWSIAQSDKKLIYLMATVKQINLEINRLIEEL